MSTTTATDCIQLKCERCLRRGHDFNIFEFSLYSFQGLVCAGMADMTRPADKLSTSQSAVLMATGMYLPCSLR